MPDLGHARTASGSSTTADRALIAKQVKDASTSFYWAMRLLPEQRREAIFAVYAFCRDVDDIADDDDVSIQDRSAGLERWRREIDLLFSGKPQHLVSRALVPSIAEFDLQKPDFIAVIDGMEMDLGVPIQAPGREEFEIYCDRVACAVGRLCVHIFGQPDAQGAALANAQGRALQITNILRDVQEDAERDRLYFPSDLLESRGIFATKPMEVISHPSFVSAWRGLASEAADWYQKADLALASCDAKAIRPARIMLEVYRANLERMRALSDAQIADPKLSKRLVSKSEKLIIAVRHGFF